MIRGLLSALFVFIACCLSAQSSYRTTLFSGTGDTVLTYTGYQFGGPTIDSLMFSIGAKNADGVKWLERFVVANKTQVTKTDFPQAIISKYKLSTAGVDVKVDTCKDLVISQRNLLNVRGQMVQKASGYDSAYYLYKCVKVVTIKLYGVALVKNLKVEYDYVSTGLRENKIPASFLVPTLVKMDGANRYYAAIVVWDMKEKFMAPKKAGEQGDTKKSCTNLFQKEFIMARVK